ncbi:hypothetical protein [Paracoccus marinaquae]|uniref:Uncharacterized protein n=1 Tax=Paracoccus marinaquae TaxID=2841926 RepID=A0ABS6ALB3_9RHOB|nr:hypothetical protein [Paracoccus marinaquae]MBU3031279.1 hypothetical protein [Paracoccus marinaquae]
MPEVLSYSDRHRVVHHRAADAPSERLVVTFAPRTDRLADSGFGTDFALSRGHDTIYVGQHRDAWHQGIDSEDLARLILPIAAGREIVAYGNSAGAYAALYFGGALAARILAIAPRNDIHPLISVNPARTRRDFRHCARLEDGPLSPQAPMVLFDPHQPKDGRLVRQWIAPAYPAADLRALTHTGHSVIVVLHRRGLLAPLVEEVFRGRVPGEIALWEPGSPRWHFARGHRLREDGDLAGALACFRLALTAEPHKNTALAVIDCARRLGEDEVMAEARRQLEELKQAARRQRSSAGGEAQEATGLPKPS